MITLVILMNCILNFLSLFYFSDYVCTLLLQTIVVKCDYVPKKSVDTFITVVRLTINFISIYQHLVVVLTAALSPSIVIVSLLLTHFTNNYCT